MFDDGRDVEADVAASRPDAAWAVPGAPAEPAAPAPDPAARALAEAVDGLLAQDLPSLPGPVALARCRAVLTQAERLGVAVCDALSDVQARELWADDGAGSLAGWLRQQPCGDGGRVTRSSRLAAWPRVRDAVLDGLIGLNTADLVTKALHDLPTASEPGQVEGVLTGAVPDLLSRWTAGNVLDPTGDTDADDRAAQARQAIDDGRHDGRRLVLTKKRLEPGYRLRGDLTDEVGAALRAQLDARAAAREQAARALRTAAEQGSTDADLFGTAGPGTPVEPVPAEPWARSDASEVLDGPPRLTDDQLAHDLLGELLQAAVDVREPGTPAPTAVTVTCTLDQLEGRLGALPGTVLLPEGPFRISRDALRRHGCHSRLSAVLLDAARSPVGASGTHRLATERERRALRAVWGDYCAVDGCGCTETVPHHVEPWWNSGTTRLDDLVPLCKGNHHDVHDGHRTLRLRDGRLIDEHGWVDPPRPPRRT